MDAVWKYVLEANECEIEMPAGSEILSFQRQRDRFCLWVQVNPAGEKEKRRFLITGTGHQNIPATADYVGTVLTEGDSLVLHCFEVKDV